MALTLAELLVAQTDDEIEAKLIAFLNASQFRTTDYYVGSVPRTIIKMYRAGLRDLSDLVPLIAAGGFLSKAETDWLTLLALELYLLTRAPATYTKQKCKLECVTGTGPYTITVGQLIAKATSGRRYVNTTGGTVPAGGSGSVTIDFQAESPGALYNADIAGTIAELVTPLPGLSIVNLQTSFGRVDSAGKCIKNGSSTGTVTPRETVPGTPPTRKRDFTITITASGQVTAGAMSIDSYEEVTGVVVKTTVAVSPIPATYTSLGDGITLGFANGAQSPSFIAGDSYVFSTPGSPIVNLGSDEESSEALRARCRGRWPSLSLVPTQDRYVAWIMQCSIDSGYGITKVRTFPSILVAGQVDLYLAGAGGAPPGAVITAVQNYVDARDGIVDKANVQAATNKNINAGGTVIVRAAQLTAVQTAAKTNWEAYIAQLAIGGDPPEGVCRLEELTQAIMDAGAVDVSGLTLNAAAANVTMSPTEVAVVGNDITTALTWQTVP